MGLIMTTDTVVNNLKMEQKKFWREHHMSCFSKCLSCLLEKVKLITGRMFRIRVASGALWHVVAFLEEGGVVLREENLPFGCLILLPCGRVIDLKDQPFLGWGGGWLLRKIAAYLKFFGRPQGQVASCAHFVADLSDQRVFLIPEPGTIVQHTFHTDRASNKKYNNNNTQLFDNTKTQPEVSHPIFLRTKTAWWQILIRRTAVLRKQTRDPAINQNSWDYLNKNWMNY